MKISDYLTCIMLFALIVISAIMYESKDMEERSNNARISRLENMMVERTVPRITIEGRAAVYTEAGCR